MPWARLANYLHDRETQRLWRAALLYLLLTVLLTYPLSIDPARRVISRSPDADLFMWTLAWDTHAFTHQPLSIFDANIYYPMRHTLAYSENLIGSALFAAPVLWLTSNPVLAMNVVALLSCLLCGVGAYMLARRAGVGPEGAAIAGLVFAFSPPRFFRIGQLHLATVQWIPFSLAFLDSYFDHGRALDLRIAVAFFTLQALTSGHGAVFLIIAIAALVAYRLALGEPLAVAKRLDDLGVGAVLLVPILLIVQPYQAAQAEVALRRSLENWAVPWSSFLASPTYVQTFLLSFVPSWRINETAEAFLFPGFLPLLLALAALVRGTPRASEIASRRRRTVWTWTAVLLDVAIVVCAAAIALVTLTGTTRLRLGDIVLLTLRQRWRLWLYAGIAVALRAAIVGRAPLEGLLRLRRWRPPFRRGAGPRRPNMAVFYALVVVAGLWLSVGPPVGLWPLVYWLPGFNFIRVPSRFTLLGMLGLAVLAGIGFDRLAARLAAPRRAMLATIVGAALVAEFAAAPLATTPYAPVIPAIDRWLDGQRKPFAVAEAPVDTPRHLGAFERRETTYMLHATAHWQKTVHGYSGVRPDLHAILYSELTNFPDEASLRSLSAIGVRYVVVHTDLYLDGEWAKVSERIGRFANRLKLEHVEGAGRVYSLGPP